MKIEWVQWVRKIEWNMDIFRKFCKIIIIIIITIIIIQRSIFRLNFPKIKKGKKIGNFVFKIFFFGKRSFSIVGIFIIASHL